jgi:hypothetical protein
MTPEAGGGTVIDQAEDGRMTVAAARPGQTTGRKHVWVLLVCAVGLLAIVPACSSSSTPAATRSSTSSTTSTTTSVVVPNQNPAEIAACTADAKVVEIALDAYMAVKGAYPSPPSPWSAASYVANFQPLTSAGDGGPFMASAPKTTSYVIEYDSAGHIWVAPPGTYRPYNKGEDFDASPDICDAAIA